jgi:hypothetical protein
LFVTILAASASTPTDDLTPPVEWLPVAGVQNNQVTIPVQGTARFYRLRK